jgi:hypothetical protein
MIPPARTASWVRVRGGTAHNVSVIDENLEGTDWEKYSQKSH